VDVRVNKGEETSNCLHTGAAKKQQDTEQSLDGVGGPGSKQVQTAEETKGSDVVLADFIPNDENAYTCQQLEGRPVNGKKKKRYQKSEKSHPANRG